MFLAISVFTRVVNIIKHWEDLKEHVANANRSFVLKVSKLGVEGCIFDLRFQNIVNDLLRKSRFIS